MADLSSAIFPHPSGMRCSSFITGRNAPGRVELLRWDDSVEWAVESGAVLSPRRLGDEILQFSLEQVPEGLVVDGVVELDFRAFDD
jgi:hypothetical protein